MAGNNLVQLNNENEHDILDVINVLSTKYYCIVRINLDSGEVSPMHFNTSISVESEIYVAEQIDSMDSLLTFLGFGMAEEEYNRLEETLDLDNIRIDLWDEGVYERTFKWTGMNGDYYYRLNFIGVGEAPYNNVVLTVLDVTERRLAEIENRKNSRIVEALSDDFLAIISRKKILVIYKEKLWLNLSCDKKRSLLYKITRRRHAKHLVQRHGDIL